MNFLSFWDESKKQSNQKKHGVSFEEARTVFFDENAMQYSDPDHSDEEDRFIMLGLSENLNALVVCHCYREGGETIRVLPE